MPSVLCKAAIGAGAANSGAITVAQGDVITLSLASTSGLSTFRWEIFSHPVNDSPLASGYNFPCPTDWETDDDGYTYVYTGSASPPTLTIPSGVYWGKILIRCTANGDDTLFDESLMLRLDSTDGVEDIAPFETTQADAVRSYVRAQQKFLRMAPGATGFAGPARPDLVSNLVRFKLDDAAGTTTISNSGSGTAFSLDTPTGAGSITFGAPQPFGDGALIVGIRYLTGTGGQTYQPSATNFTASCWVQFKKNPALGGANFVSLFGKVNTTDSTFALGFDLNLGEFKCKVGAGGTDTTSTGQPLMVGERNHLAMTYDGSNIRLYQNGVLTQTTAKTGTLDWSNSHNWIVGNAGATGAIFILNECKFDSTVKTLAQLKTEVYQGQGWNA